MRLPKVPRGARHLRTYAELDSYLHDFVQRRYPFLWIVGRHGTAKTESIRAAVRGQPVYYHKAGQLTPTRFHVECYRHRGEPIILDDAEHLLDNKIGAKQIAALGDTSQSKLMSYATTSRVLDDVPPNYYTTSPLCIIANRMTSHLDIQSRAVTLYHDPTNLEIHRAIARWFWDQEIHDWFGRHLYRLQPLDTRWYLFAAADKRAERDWRQIILVSHALDRASCVVQDLEGDVAYPEREDKARRFTELIGKAKGSSRSTYFRLWQRLEEEGRLIVQAVPPIQLRRTKAPGTPSALELDSMQGIMLPAQPEEEANALDLPARQAFVEPIRGAPQAQTPPPRIILDDSMPWERPQDDDDEA